MISLTIIGLIITGIFFGVPAIAYLTAKMVTLGRLKGEESYRDHCIKELIKHQKEEMTDGYSTRP